MRSMKKQKQNACVSRAITVSISLQGSFLSPGINIGTVTLKGIIEGPWYVAKIGH